MVCDAAAQKTVGEEIRRVYGQFGQKIDLLAKVAVGKQKGEKSLIERTMSVNKIK
jgi:hypothetical protein